VRDGEYAKRVRWLGQLNRDKTRMWIIPIEWVILKKKNKNVAEYL